MTGTKCVVYANPFLDRMVQVPNDFLKFKGLERAQSNATSDVGRVNDLWKLTKGFEPRTKGLGGAATNVARVFAHLDHPTEVVGVRGIGKRGNEVETLVRENGITPYYIIGKEPQGCADCYIDPSGERTMSVYFGASNEFQEEHVWPEQIAHAGLVFIEGYMYFAEGVAEKAIGYAKEMGAITAIGLPTSNVVRMFAEKMMSTLTEVDYIFGNEEEILALTGAETTQEALSKFGLDQTVIVTNGPRECFIKPSGQDTHYTCPVQEIKKVVNPTGAGDVFSAVVLSEVLKGGDLRQGVEKAIRVAQHHIQQWSLPQTPEDWGRFVSVAN